MPFSLPTVVLDCEAIALQSSIQDSPLVEMTNEVAPEGIQFLSLFVLCHCEGTEALAFHCCQQIAVPSSVHTPVRHFSVSLRIRLQDPSVPSPLSQQFHGDAVPTSIRLASGNLYVVAQDCVSLLPCFLRGFKILLQVLALRHEILDVAFKGTDLLFARADLLGVDTYLFIKSLGRSIKFSLQGFVFHFGRCSDESMVDASISNENVN